MYGPLYRKHDDDDSFEMRHATADGLLTPSTQSTATGYSSPTVSCLSPATSTTSSFDTLDEVASKLKPVLKRTANPHVLTDWALRHPNNNPSRALDFHEPARHQSWPREIVHFNPDVVEVQFLPESPIIQAFPDDGLWDSDDDEDVLIHKKLISSSQSAVMSYWTSFWKLGNDTSVFNLSTHERTVDQPPESLTELALLLIQMLQSLIALCASWLLYQSISAGIAPLAWLTKIKVHQRSKNRRSSHSGSSHDSFWLKTYFLDTIYIPPISFHCLWHAKTAHTHTHTITQPQILLANCFMVFSFVNRYSWTKNARVIKEKWKFVHIKCPLFQRSKGSSR